MTTQELGGVEGFRPRARLLQLLGDQLIGSARLAIFELVKNAYDADATAAIVRMRALESGDAAIEVVDDGEGMDADTVRNIWLVPGHDHRARAKETGTNARTKSGRLPLGEKGVGRFAVHKLGNEVTLVTRRAGGAEVVVHLDWDAIAVFEFLADVPVSIVIREPEVFVGDDHGTRVTIGRLRQDWTRGDVRRLARQVRSISAPFGATKDDFRTEIILDEGVKWLEGLPEVDQLLDEALWTFKFVIAADGTVSWTYSFAGLPQAKVEPRAQTSSNAPVLLDPSYLPDNRGKRPVVSGPELHAGIGPVSGELFVFDRDKAVLDLLANSEELKQYLNENGGIRVYRDGMRVYNYGESGDDWLALDVRRVNSPSKRISNNIVLGSVHLDASKSTGLREKTSREGFMEGEAFSNLRAIVVGAIAAFENEREPDKRRLRDALQARRATLSSTIDEPISRIRKAAARVGIEGDIDADLRRALAAYGQLRDVLVRAGTSNASLAIIYHEIDHGVRLVEKIANGDSPDGVALRQEISRLVQVLDGSSDLLRRSAPKTALLGDVAKRAADLNVIRLVSHGIDLHTSLPSDGESGKYLTTLPVGLVLGAITNLIDNSIYWMRARWADESASGKHLWVEVRTTSDGRPSIVVADTGTGFADDLSVAAEPFVSRRPDGIGVGLYYVRLIMQSIGGEIRLLEDRRLRAMGYDGAIVELVFKGAK